MKPNIITLAYLLFLFISLFSTKSIAQDTIYFDPRTVHGETILHSQEYIEDGAIKKLVVYEYAETNVYHYNYKCIKWLKDYVISRFKIDKPIKIRFANIYGKNGHWGNAINFLEKGTNELYIVFDKARINRLTHIEARFIMAHELGHLVRRHYSSYKETKKIFREAEADFLAGYILGDYLHKSRYNKKHTKKAIKKLYGKGRNINSNSPDYPSPKRRKELFTIGFKKSSYPLSLALRYK